MSNPFVIFSQWYAKAIEGTPVNPDIVALASATKDGRPSVRMVFYRGIREGGLSFFTNYESRKGRELLENPFAALVFHWPGLGRQVRIEGSAEQLSPKESDDYFGSRPLQSQVTAAISVQSRPLLDAQKFRRQLTAAEPK